MKNDPILALIEARLAELEGNVERVPFTFGDRPPQIVLDSNMPQAERDAAIARLRAERRLPAHKWIVVNLIMHPSSHCERA
jgi:hypothetical protein